MNLDTDAHPHLKKELAGFSHANGNFSVCVESRFDSSHYLYAYMPDGSDEPIHGHSWLVQIILTRYNYDIQKNGICLDFLSVSKRLRELVERIGHLCINDLEEFKSVNPTAENIARWFYRGLQNVVESEEGGRVIEIRIHEGPGNIAIFQPQLKQKCQNII